MEWSTAGAWTRPWQSGAQGAGQQQTCKRCLAMVGMAKEAAFFKEDEAIVAVFSEFCILYDQMDTPPPRPLPRAWLRCAAG